MDIKKCSTCNNIPRIQTDELGMTYRFICTECDKHTQYLMSPSSTLVNPYCDDATYQRLIEEWNIMN